MSLPVALRPRRCPLAFTDPKMPPGYAPFGIQCIGGKIYVSFAHQAEVAQDDTTGAGNGFVDIFDTNGALLERSMMRGVLNSPWGLALAPMLQLFRVISPIQRWQSVQFVSIAGSS